MAKSLGGNKVSNHIPQDLALLVLSKLPLKSLKRFGCVCKIWSLLFENQYFITMFRANFISIPHSYYNDDTSLILQEVVFHPHKIYLHLLSGHRFENRLKLNLPNPFQEENFYILESNTATNGILCLSQGDKVVLWNPTTDEVNVIPPSSMEFVSPYWDTLINVHGFGYDHVRDDYKIIRHITYFRQDDEVLLRLNLPPPKDAQWEKKSYNDIWEIYSLRCNTWEKLDVNMPPNFHGNNLLYTNDGIFHWLFENNDQLCLVSFDCSNYVFFTTNTPLTIPKIDPNFDFEDIDPNFEFEFLEARLVMLNGSISLISWNSEIPTFHISILGELSVSESWIELFIIGPFPSIEYPIIAGRNGDIFFKKKDGKLVCFDLSTQMIEELGGLEESQSDIYMKNLVLIGGINH